MLQTYDEVLLKWGLNDQVLSNHMDMLGMVLDNVQLYESSRQEAKRSQVTTPENNMKCIHFYVCILSNPFCMCVCMCVCQALIEMAQVLSMEHHSFEVLLSKMAATIMPFTHAQYCTIFVPGDQTSAAGGGEVHYPTWLLFNVVL